MAVQIRQLESLNSWTADGATTVWNFSFASGYIDPSHVMAYQVSPTGVRTELTLTLSGPNQATISPAVPSGYELTIYRATPTAAPLVDFTDRAQLSEASLDLSNKQAIFTAAETQDALAVASERVDQMSVFVNDAAGSASAAAASAGAANTSANNAANSATLAQQWATQTASEVVAGQGYGAQKYANDANTSAQAAAASAASVNDANLVHKAGAETISGVKTFTAQPVGITKASVGLGNVDNTADTAKPVSTAQQAAIDALGSFRNKVRNGAFNIAQRSSPLTAPAHNTYTLDGWLWWRVNAGVADVAMVAGPNNEFLRALGVTITTADASVAATDYSAITQPIEGFLIRDLLGNPVAIQFRVKSSVVGTYYVALRNVNGGSPDRSYLIPYTISAANTWETKTLTVPAGLTTGGSWDLGSGMGLFLTFTLMAGANFHGAAANTWLNANVMALADQANLFGAVGNVFALAGVQLEQRASSSKFEHRDPGSELAFCLRYYQVGAVSVAAGGATSTGGAAAFPVALRATPTMVRTGNINSTSEAGTTFTPVNGAYFNFGNSAAAAGGTYTASAEL